MITAFAVLDPPLISKAVLGSDLALQPEGYGFMYVYTGWLVLFLLSGICMYRGLVSIAWLLLLPAIVTVFFWVYKSCYTHGS